jgi:16S rRNA (cytosine1402-N4)-methyltransferase
MSAVAMLEPVTSHEPVMLQRVVELLATSETGVLVDATVGAGGHAAALLAASGPDVVLVGFDRDPDALALAADRLVRYEDRVVLVHDGFETLAERVRPILADAGPLLGVLYDLGVSSMQLDQAARGFSFRGDGPLDMRMDPTRGRTAADLVDGLDAGELARLLREYGEERYARRIAAAIVAARPLDGTAALAEVVRRAVPSAALRGRHGAIHPATRTFQALRIAVNAELDSVRASLPQALDLAPPAAETGSPRHPSRGGRVAVLAYHSLEDRIVKRVFADAARGCVCPPDLPVCACGREPIARALTRGAETPDAEEVAANPRARSARLRAVEVVGPARTTTGR